VAGATARRSGSSETEAIVRSVWEDTTAMHPTYSVDLPPVPRLQGTQPIEADPDRCPPPTPTRPGAANDGDSWHDG
jgi:hypothetical protein